MAGAGQPPASGLESGIVGATVLPGTVTVGIVTVGNVDGMDAGAFDVVVVGVAVVLDFVRAFTPKPRPTSSAKTPRTAVARSPLRGDLGGTEP